MEHNAVLAPDPRLGPLLRRGYVAFAQPATAHERWLATPAPTVTLILNLGPTWGGLPRCFVAGLTDRPATVDQGGEIECLDLKLTPLGAYRLLGTPMHELTNRVIDLVDVLPGIEDLADRLAGAPDRRAVLDAFLLDRAGRGPVPAPEVAVALRRLTESRGTRPVGALAEEVGWSRRHLVDRFQRQVGLPPKTVARVLRFRHLVSRLGAGPVRWTELAAECGYYDQAHLIRDFRAFTGTTPTGFLAGQVTSVQYPGVPAT
ncbi:MAG TPA: helix-turn-helix domain-containing protein [Actinophytocola sp.]|uniref:helix-turn-helix domain-containing protein n=1 Tax=Actinophytocola sp. TaxID=1872138 RepID=UPI002DB62AC8|nr:helix-turn-helix domain-containing protein [Actinophytocola sp.]HEU5471866.1 helix-turn-helix domain-containing protein [Actinophytocola sp.]